MIDVDNLDPATDPARYLLALAECLGVHEEITLSPTDQALLKAAAVAYSAQIDAGLA